MVDKSNNETDIPNENAELPALAKARYLKIENIHMPTGKFAISGLRVFGKGTGTVPDTIKNLIVLRGDTERRNAWLKWQVNDKATGYTVYTGSAPDKLYTSIMLYGVNEYYFTAMEKDRPYYFQVEAFNENGIGKRTQVVKVE